MCLFTEDSSFQQEGCTSCIIEIQSFFSFNDRFDKIRLSNLRSLFVLTIRCLTKLSLLFRQSDSRNFLGKSFPPTIDRKSSYCRTVNWFYSPWGFKNRRFALARTIKSPQEMVREFHSLFSWSLADVTVLWVA